MPKGLVPIAPLRRGLFVLGRNEKGGAMGECGTVVRYNCNKGERVKRHLKVKK